MDILNYPIIQISIGILAAIIIAYVDRKIPKGRKDINCLEISNIPILNIDEVKGKVRVSYEGKLLDDARLVLLRVWNSGNVSIDRNDFEQPLTFCFGDKAEVLSTSIIETKPDTVKSIATLEKNVNEVILKPLLLKKNESIKIKVLLTGFEADKDIQVKARIKGIDEIHPLHELPIRKRIIKMDKIYKISIIWLIRTGFPLLLIFVVFPVLNTNFFKIDRFPILITGIAHIIAYILIPILLASVIATFISWAVIRVLKLIESIKLSAY